MKNTEQGGPSNGSPLSRRDACASVAPSEHRGQEKGQNIYQQVDVAHAVHDRRTSGKGAAEQP
jgi:hypothetical protein